MFKTRYLWILLLPLILALCASAITAKDNDLPPATTVAVNDLPPATTIAVTVSLDGKPLKGGRIFFHLPKDQFMGCKIKSGKCKLDCVPAGTYKITIESKGLPSRYSSFEQAVLVCEVVPGPGKNVFELNLLSR